MQSQESVQQKIICSDREEWLKVRRKSIGASEAASVLGANPWGSPLQVYASKIDEDEPEDSGSQASEWGLLLEPVLADHYARVTGRTLKHHGQYTLHVDAEHDFLTATLDREIERDLTGRFDGPGALEIKTGHARFTQEWDEDEAPLQYLIQLMHQLRVTGFKWGSFAVLLGGQDFRWFDLGRDDDFIEKLVDRERDFWRHVETRTPPPPISGSEREAAIIKRLYPKTTGATVDLPGDFVQLDDERLALKEEVKNKKARLDFIDNIFKHRIGDAQYGLLASGCAYSLKSQHRASFVMPATDFRVLRRIKP